MNDPEFQFRMQSMVELSADLLVLRNALNELWLALGDLQFQIDSKRRAAAENETGLMLKRIGADDHRPRY